MPLEPHPPFERFKPWALTPHLAWPAGQINVGSDARQVRRQIREAAPHAPGVYGMVDSQGELVYVGRSKSLRQRLISYFAASAPRKARRIVARTSRLLWEEAPDEFATLHRELELIRLWRPRFNVRGQPNRLRSAYLVLGRSPAPSVYLSAAPAGGDAVVIGPVRAGRQHRQAVQTLNDCFQLRTCGQRTPMRFADQGELFSRDDAARCLRRDLGICLGPCASACSSGQYGEQVRAARRFLQGHDLAVLRRLKEEMSAAAVARRYEEAAVLRNLWENLTTLHEQLRRFREGQRQYYFVYPVGGRAGRCLWYLVRGGQLAAVVEEPCDRGAAERCLSVIDRVYPDRGPTASRPTAGRMAREDLEMVLLTTGWFHAHPEQLRRTLSVEEAKARLRTHLRARP